MGPRPTKLCSHGPGVKTLGFQLKDGSSILLGNRVEGLFYLFTLGVIISGIMVISALNPCFDLLLLLLVRLRFLYCLRLNLLL